MPPYDEWLTREEADSLCKNMYVLIGNDGLTRFLRVSVLVAEETERAEVVVERLDTGAPIFRITTRKELQIWVRLFDKELRKWKDAANRQTMLALKGERR
jgi:hypothetical protein